MKNKQRLFSFFFFFIIYLCAYQIPFAQKSKKEVKDGMLTYVADSACNCISKINVDNRSVRLVAENVYGCIQKEAAYFRFYSILIDKDSLEIYMNDSTVDLDHNFRYDPSSDEFLNYYFDVKTYLMENCTGLRARLSVQDDEHDNSVSKNKKAIKFYNQALDKMEKESYQAAIDLLMKSLAKDKKFAFAWDELGLAYRKTEQYDKAIDAYEHSIEQDPKGKTPWQNMAVVYIYKKDYQGAIICYKKLADLDLYNPEVYYGLGRVYAQYLNEYEFALENICVAFKLYKEINSDYLADAKTMISLIHDEMKKTGDEDKFDAILLKHFPK